MSHTVTRATEDSTPVECVLSQIERQEHPVTSTPYSTPVSNAHCPNDSHDKTPATPVMVMIRSRVPKI